MLSTEETTHDDPFKRAMYEIGILSHNKKSSKIGTLSIQWPLGSQLTFHAGGTPQCLDISLLPPRLKRMCNKQNNLLMD